MIIDIDPNDHCYHPTTDDEIIELVKWARSEHRTLRVRGDGHSVAHAIYADPLGGIDNRVKPPRPLASRNMNVVLDHYGENGIPGWRPVHGEDHVIEVDGGMVLGSPRDGSSTKGLMQQLCDRGLALRSTGGIAHQTVAGFIATASAGGSRYHSVSELVRGVTLIDGTGASVKIDQGHLHFHAVVPHLGLLGVVTKVRLQCQPKFTVKGKQVTRDANDVEVDLCGTGTGTPMAAFLSANEYARIEWWPQRGAERLRVWTGTCDGPPPPDFQRQPFNMFKPGEQLRAAIALTALGNLHDPARMKAGFKEVGEHSPHQLLTAENASDVVSELRGMGLLGRWVASQVEAVPGGAGRLAIEGDNRRSWIERRLLPTLIPKRLPRALIRWLLPSFFRQLLDQFTKNGDVPFHDHAWRVLPMDDDVDDLYLPIEFTEIWVPLKRAAGAMEHLHTYFREPKRKRDALARTGTFEIELYVTKPSPFWLDPAYSDRNDLWSDGALRINPYWYGRNAGDPTQTFFPRFWDLLHEEGIPYRLHWGKFLPPVDENPWWPEWIRAQYRHWDDFMALRERYDPDDIFVNDYWRTHLSLPPARPAARSIADLHCHYPMHVLADSSRAAVLQRWRCRGWLWRLLWFWLDGLRCFLMNLAARKMNFRGWSASWRVGLQGLQEARAGLVLSVLYDPVHELLIVPGRQRPRPRAFDALICQITCVEAELKRADNGNGSYRVVKSARELTTTLAEGRTAFVHCVEGGLYLGDNADDIRANVEILAKRGVAYITLAHLWYRGIASIAPALPGMSDEAYHSRFHQHGTGLSKLGRAAVEAMYDHMIMVDVCHMDAVSLGATFELLDELDADRGARPHEHPVIASHAGYRFGDLHYMLDAQTIRAIARRDGVIGLILAHHQLENGLSMTQGQPSRFYALDRHIKAIHRITRSYDHVCIGSDLDGFIKPTVSGIDSAADIRAIETWLRGNYPPDAADAILFRNAERVVTSALG